MLLYVTFVILGNKELYRTPKNRTRLLQSPQESPPSTGKEPPQSPIPPPPPKRRIQRVVTMTPMTYIVTPLILMKKLCNILILSALLHLRGPLDQVLKVCLTNHVVSAVRNQSNHDALPQRKGSLR